MVVQEVTGSEHELVLSLGLALKTSRQNVSEQSGQLMPNLYLGHLETCPLPVSYDYSDPWVSSTSHSH